MGESRQTNLAIWTHAGEQITSEMRTSSALKTISRAAFKTMSPVLCSGWRLFLVVDFSGDRTSLHRWCWCWEQPILSVWASQDHVKRPCLCQRQVGRQTELPLQRVAKLWPVRWVVAQTGEPCNASLLLETLDTSTKPHSTSEQKQPCGASTTPQKNWQGK